MSATGDPPARPIAVRLFRAMASAQGALAIPPALAAFGLRAVTRKAVLGILSDRALRQRIDIPVHSVSPRVAACDAARNLARCILDDEGLDALACKISAWDGARATTPHGDRIARLAASVAIADLSGASGRGTGQTLAALDALELRLARRPDDPVMATLAAMAHIERARHIGHSRPEQDHRNCHLSRADDILDRFEPAACGSALLAEARYRLFAVLPGGGARIREAHDDWADLDPTDPVVWAVHATTLLSRGFATPAEVVASGLRAEWQTYRWLGRGGYALALLPVVESA